MSGVIEHDQARRLQAAVEEALEATSQELPEATAKFRTAMQRVLTVMESSNDVVVLAQDELLSTQQVADALGVSRMTVVRLIDRGELAAEGGGVHRRITAGELGRYRLVSAQRRRAAMQRLTDQIDEDIPADRVIRTR